LRPRHFGAASWDDEDDEEDELDLSGFLSSAPPPPPVVERKRGASGMGNAGPRTQAAPEQEPAQMFGRPSNIGYVPSQVTAGNPLNPLYADDNAMLSPKIWVAAKTIGAGLAITGLGMAIHKGARPVALPIAIIGGAAYLHPALGFRHGLLADKLADKNVVLKGAGVLGTHTLGVLVFRNAYRLTRGKGLAFGIRGA
jgi:hypothetical protein